MSESPFLTPLSAGLREFLAGPAPGQPLPQGEPAADLAGCELYVEEHLLGQSTSRFVKEGGVRLNRVTSYRVPASELSPMYRLRPDAASVQPVLLKFWLMFDELPSKRQYARIRIRISLRPSAPVMLLRPDAGAIDLGAEGFGWTYQGSADAPLAPRREFPMAMLELSPDATELTGLLDAEAQIDRLVLGTAQRRRAAPVNSAAPFVVSLPGGESERAGGHR